MKSIVAMLLGALLCVQPVSAMQVKEPVLYTQRASYDICPAGRAYSVRSGIMQ